jgi:hypothetical protein
VSRQDSLRASDSDRDAIVERLRHAGAEGRLAPDELDQRVHDALTAVTYADLSVTVHDLPSPSRAPAKGRQGRDRQPERRRTVSTLAVSALRANPFLIVFLIPLVAVTGAMLIAASAVWGVFMVILLVLGARVHGGPWNLIWDRE